jgi:hypothetical protein
VVDVGISNADLRHPFFLLLRPIALRASETQRNTAPAAALNPGSSTNPGAHRPSTGAAPIGFSLVAIALGAILKFAVTAQVAGVSISTVGVILMVVGAIGLIVSLWMIQSGRAAPEL